MPRPDEVLRDRERKQKRDLSKTTGVFSVDTTSPFKVFLDGALTSVPALKVAGLSYSVGTSGMYLHRQGQLPLCIPTA